MRTGARHDADSIEPSLAAFLCSIPSAALAQEAYTNRTANVRAGPDRTYPAVAQLPPGVGLQVMGCIDDYSWCDVVFGDNRGWVYAGSLSYPYQSGRVPILGYGAVIGLPIITFSLGNYWDSYYRGRPWYRNRSYWVRRAPPPHFRPPQRPQPRPGFNRGPEPRRVDRGSAVITRPARPERPALRAPDNRPSGGGRQGGRESRGDGRSQRNGSEH